jgi:iron complex outermembrane recepter protein
LTPRRASEKMRGSMRQYSRVATSTRVSRHRRWETRAAALAALVAALLAGDRAAGEDAEEASAVVVAQAADEEPDDADAPATEAPEPSDAPAGVEVMTVRGRTAGGIETDVPASITQFDASMIQALGAQDVSDLARVTPNVNIVQPGATQATFFVRGIGLQSFDANATGAVTIFQDDVALDLPAIQTGQLYDIHEVEIMRGPQGTGAFRNASGGAIRVASNLPSGNYGGFLRSSIGRYAADGGQGAHHGLIQDYEGYLEMPLVQDSLSSRFAFRLRNSEPYQTNGCGNAIPFALRTPRPKSENQPLLDAADICGERGDTIFPRDTISQIPEGLDRKVDNEDNWAARGSLRFQPPDTDLDFVLNAHGSRLDEDQTVGQAIGTSRITGLVNRGPFFGGSAGNSGTPDYWEPDQREEFEKRCTIVNCQGPVNEHVSAFERELSKKRPLDSKPYRGDYNREGVTQRDAWGGYLSGKAQWNDIDIFVLGSYDRYERFRDQDTDFTPDIMFEVIEDDEAWQTYEELSFAGELGFTLLEWELGGYYLKANLDDDASTLLASDARIDRVYSQNTESFGTWGQFTWDILDEVTLGGGVRWNWEHKDFKIDRALFIGAGAGIRTAADQDETWQTPTGNLTLTYHFDEGVSAFAKYTRGFKAGHFNALASENVSRPPADPEYNDAWEAGFAGAWFDRRLSASVAYFYYRYEDYQVFLFRDVAFEPPVLEIINAHEAENYGVEVEGRLFPLRGFVPRAVEDLQLTANFGWLHGEFIDFQIRNTLPTGTGDAVPVTIDLSGDSLLNSPEFKVAGSATWTFDMGRFGAVIPRYDFSWTDDVFFGLNEGRGTAAAISADGAPRLPEFAIGQTAYWLHNLRLGYRTPSSNVEFAIWCRNVADKVYKNYAFDATNFSQVVLNFTGQPRTIGFDVIVTF